ncbi:CDP-glycerol glycerophosphotransferase family protein [Ligilactobacillus acidipiscis]|uniref:CDP-glycerol glycerophosphotransferase family protein n=1 Tax=Ligilactobacillus acidipiscis TaxID=89059 RepID=UPI0023F62A99|nr:CDP-glycerol glycerophosphotransferase family protein [Ligilactobacillus acidipiscis]WEV55801.1 CDP-glycerol glycerophosphotransferase family protein [Ligilactobacillus acidipiscis]
MLKTVYLWLVSFCSKIFSKTNSDQIVYLLSFAGNENFIVRLAQRVKQEPGGKLVVLYRPNCVKSAHELRAHNIECREFSDNFYFLTHQLKTIMQAKLIFADNYFAFLGGCQFDHDRTRVVQIWHANGAVKTFGWEEPRTKDRSTNSKKRFQKVYDQFDDFIVGSAKMGEVFCNSYHQPIEKMKVLGYPRTDRLFSNEKKTQKRKQFFAEYPELAQKEIILYAPTYRETVTGETYFDLPQDFTAILANLSDEQVMLVKLHPHVKEAISHLKKQHLAHVFWVDDFTTDDLLLVSSRLITDYSSVIFDYTLLENARQIIFYCYDFEKYAQIVGIQKDFNEWLPGKMVSNASDLQKLLQIPLPDAAADFSVFNHLWNKANDGNAISHVLENYFYGN